MLRYRFPSSLAFVLTLAAGLPAVASAQVGPDVTVYSLSGTMNYGSDGTHRGYSVGTTSCNIGDEPVNWCDSGGGCGGGMTAAQHPVIAQNMFRLKDGRFTQIGGSWLKHGFLSTNSPAGSSCTGPSGQQCISPPFGGDQLGIGCTDTYGASLNGTRPMGMPAEVNPTTGVFPFPETVVGTDDSVDQRMKVAIADLDPAQNAGAIYWLEGHYIADNDAMAGNGFNNASYRPVSIGASPTFDLSLTGSTIREKWAFDAWAATDAGVETIRLTVPTLGGPDQGFNVARKVTPPLLQGGTWHYEYVVHNMNSDRAARLLEIDFVSGTTVTNVGFRDYDHHSGEYEPTGGLPYSTTDWVSAVDGGSGLLSWQTDTYAVAPEANAIRWSTMYNFWFDADAGPDAIETHRLGLFKPGIPEQLEFWVGAADPMPFLDGFESGDTTAWSSTVP